MSLVVGCDPGHSGAFATYNSDTGDLSIEDMPAWSMMVGKKSRKRIDAVALAELMECLKLSGVDLFVLEAVGGRPRQGAAAGFVFGYGVGMIYMAAINSRLALETVPPATWKKIMRVPKDDAGIAMRYDEMFPNHRALIRGAKGAIKHDRAEAAILARFGAERIQPTMTGDVNADWRLAYQRAQTGA